MKILPPFRVVGKTRYKLASLVSERKMRVEDGRAKGRILGTGYQADYIQTTAREKLSSSLFKSLLL